MTDLSSNKVQVFTTNSLVSEDYFSEEDTPIAEQQAGELLGKVAKNLTTHKQGSYDQKELNKTPSSLSGDESGYSSLSTSGYVAQEAVAKCAADPQQAFFTDISNFFKQSPATQQTAQFVQAEVQVPFYSSMSSGWYTTDVNHQFYFDGQNAFAENGLSIPPPIPGMYFSQTMNQWFNYVPPQRDIPQENPKEINSASRRKPLLYKTGRQPSHQQAFDRRARVQVGPLDLSAGRRKLKPVNLSSASAPSSFSVNFQYDYTAVTVSRAHTYDDCSQDLHGNVTLSLPTFDVITRLVKEGVLLAAQSNLPIHQLFLKNVRKNGHIFIFKGIHQLETRRIGPLGEDVYHTTILPKKAKKPSHLYVYYSAARGWTVHSLSHYNFRQKD